MSEGAIKEKAIKAMKDQLESDEDDDEEMEEQQSEEEDEDDGMIKMDFSAKNKKSLEVQKPKEVGISAMKFMKKSEGKMKEQLRADTENAISQIKDQQSFVNSSNKFAGKGLEVPMAGGDVAEIDSRQVIEAARRVTGRAASLPPKEEAPATAAESKKENKKNQNVTFDQNDLVGFSTEKKAIIRDQSGKSEAEDSLLKTLFVTNPEAEDEFEQEKEADVEGHLGQTVKKVDVKQGWGEWAGAGVDMSKNDAKKEKAEQAR